MAGREWPPQRGFRLWTGDASLAGFRVRPFSTGGGFRTIFTYYENARVPANMVLGAVNQGWRLITEQLNHERIGLAALTYGANGCFDAAVDWARDVDTGDGRKLIDIGSVQTALAAC